MNKLLLSFFVGTSLHGAASDVALGPCQDASSLVELSSLAHKPQRLFHDGENFIVQDMGKVHHIARHEVHKDIREKGTTELLQLQRQGYFDIRSSVDGENYSIEFQPRLNGGGPITGRAAYYITKAIIYGCTLGLASMLFKRKKSPVNNTFVDIAIGECMNRGSGYVAALVTNHDKVRRIVQDAAPIVIMTTASVPSVTAPIWIESAALGAQAFFSLIPVLP